MFKVGDIVRFRGYCLSSLMGKLGIIVRIEPACGSYDIFVYCPERTSDVPDGTWRFSLKTSRDCLELVSRA